jgi:hypothetical protein
MSTFRLTHLAGVALLAVVVAAGTAKATKADPSMSIGAQSFGDLGSPTANTGNINTAMTFTADKLMTGGNQQGVFIGMLPQMFPAFTFNPTIPHSLAFGNSVFGHFTSTSITEVENTVGATGGTVAFDVNGNWTPGSFFSVGHGPFAALLTMGLTQTPAGTGVISLSATFSSTNTVIPEPPSFVLVLTGLLVGLGIYGLRRGRRFLVSA